MRLVLKSDNKRSKSNPRRIDGMVDRVLDSLGLAERHHGWSMVEKWPDVVGEHYARHSEAFRYAEGTLFVSVEDSSWRQTMSMDLENILKKIHSYPHGRVVKQIHLVGAKKGF